MFLYDSILFFFDFILILYDFVWFSLKQLFLIEYEYEYSGIKNIKYYRKTSKNDQKDFSSSSNFFKIL